MFALDEALDALARVGRAAEPVAELARGMAAEALHREPLKLAISLLGRAGDERDVALLETVARHDEFSLVAGVALASVLDDPVQAWWRVGCLATRLGARRGGRPAGRDGRRAARRGARLAAARRLRDRRAARPRGLRVRDRRAARGPRSTGLVDDELLDGACAILSALVAGGPALDMDDYEPARAWRSPVLDLLADRPPSVVRMWAVVDLRNWAEVYEQHVAIAERCGRLLGRPEARRFVAARLDRPGEALRVWGIAESMGLDPWEAGWRHLEARRRLDALYLRLARTPTPTAGRAWSRTPSARSRSTPWPPAPRTACCPPRTDGEAAHALAQLVQAMRPGRWSAPLVASALLSPVIFIRNGALRALEQTGTASGAAPVESALRRLAEVEPTDDVRARAGTQLARLA